jgi:hypothetical protein
MVVTRAEPRAAELLIWSRWLLNLWAELHEEAATAGLEDAERMVLLEAAGEQLCSALAAWIGEVARTRDRAGAGKRRRGAVPR